MNPKTSTLNFLFVSQLNQWQRLGLTLVALIVLLAQCQIRANANCDAVTTHTFSLNVL